MTYNVRTYVKPPVAHWSRSGYLKEVVRRALLAQQQQAQRSTK